MTLASNVSAIFAAYNSQLNYQTNGVFMSSSVSVPFSYLEILRFATPAEVSVGTSQKASLSTFCGLFQYLIPEHSN